MTTTLLNKAAGEVLDVSPLPMKAPRGRPRVHATDLWGPGGADLGKNASRQARRLAAMVLEVLAGTRSPLEAAQALEVTVARYYQLESRALRGLLAVCEPLQQRGPRPATELKTLRRANQRLEREVLRQQALVRAAQRTIGLGPPPPAKKNDKKHRQRRLARALNITGRLQNDSEEKDASATGVTAVDTATAAASVQ